MGLFKNSGQSKNDAKAAREELKNARKSLHTMKPRVVEDAEYWKKNGRVIDAEKNVPWIRR